MPLPMSCSAWTLILGAVSYLQIELNWKWFREIQQGSSEVEWLPQRTIYVSWDSSMGERHGPWARTGKVYDILRGRERAGSNRSLFQQRKKGHQIQLVGARKQEEVFFLTAEQTPAEHLATGCCKCKMFTWAHGEIGKVPEREPLRDVNR